MTPSEFRKANPHLDDMALSFAYFADSMKVQEMNGQTFTYAYSDEARKETAKAIPKVTVCKEMLAAVRSVCDDSVFSDDQIMLLERMLEHIHRAIELSMVE